MHDNGSGEQTRDYVYAGDVARANVLALAEGAPWGSYNVGTGVETSVNELYETMAELCGCGGCPRNTGRRSAAISCAAPWTPRRPHVSSAGVPR